MSLGWACKYVLPNHLSFGIFNQIMNTYELVLIFSSALSPEDQKKIISKVEKFVTDAKGRMLATEEWGKKTLAYFIKKRNEGFYWLVRFELNPDEEVKLNNNLRLEDQTIRFMLSKRDAIGSTQLKPAVSDIKEDVTEVKAGKEVKIIKKAAKKPAK